MRIVSVDYCTYGDVRNNDNLGFEETMDFGELDRIKRSPSNLAMLADICGPPVGWPLATAVEVPHQVTYQV